MEPLLAALRERLLILGYAKGQNMRMAVRYADAQVERLKPQTVELFEVTGGTVRALILAAELSRAPNNAVDRPRS